MGFNLSSILPQSLLPVETRVKLSVGGRSYNTWKSININRSLTQIAGSFSFTTANRYAGNNSEWNIQLGDECTVEVADQRIITGYIDEIEDGYDLNSHNVSFSGRDKTADLVDCCYDIFDNESEFKNITVFQIIQKLCKPFDITVLGTPSVLTELATQKQELYTIETGSFVYEQIATLCQQYGILPISDGYGNLYLTRTGSIYASDNLVVGKNIKSNRINWSDRERYSVYYADGFAKTNAFNTKLIAEGKLLDNTINRTRPLIITVGEQASDDTCQKRAAWEARIRMGAGRKAETVVRKWTQSKDDVVWPLNGIVRMEDEKLGITDQIGSKNNKLLIAGINFTLDENGGELTTLALVHPDTFELKKNKPVTQGEGLNAFGRPLKSFKLN